MCIAEGKQFYLIVNVLFDFLEKNFNPRESYKKIVLIFEFSRRKK